MLSKKKNKELEARENAVREVVSALSDKQKKLYFEELNEKIKDPDNYAALNFLFSLGLHHLYIGRYVHFFVEFTLMLSFIALIVSGSPSLFLIGVGGFLILTIYQLVKLFLSQGIIREFNCDLSEKLLQKTKGEP